MTALLTSTQIDIGNRRDQQDCVVAHEHEDGAWVIAVADGHGCRLRGGEAARAAIECVPERITTDVEMDRVFVAANNAVRGALADSDSPNADNGTLATLAIAAWCPQGGLHIGWLGDSVAFLIPGDGQPGWHSKAHGGLHSYSLAVALGMYQQADGQHQIIHDTGRFSDEISQNMLRQQLTEGDMTVIVATDGLYRPLLIDRYGEAGSFTDDPSDGSLRFAIAENEFGNADRIAEGLMGRARDIGLKGNAAVAVGLIRQLPAPG